MDQVLIVGAGPAGLALIHALQQVGIAPRVIDKEPRVAEPWRRRHDQLRLNTARGLSHNPGLRMPKRYGLLPSRDDYVAYLESYVAFLGLPIEWGRRALRVDRLAAGWRVVTDKGQLDARHVVIASGPDAVPVLPTWPGQAAFTGRIIHAADFRHADDYAGKRVLIVGGGNSGVDIANHLSRAALAACWMSIRAGTWIGPLLLPLGRPGHETLSLLRPLPVWLQERILGLTADILLGNLRRHGITRPQRGVVDRSRSEGVTIAADDGFVAAVKAGRITCMPGIDRFEATEVVFADGRRSNPEVVICATGYRTGLEPLVGHLGVLQPGGRPLIDAEAQQPECPGLWLFGTTSSIYGNMNVRRAQARKVAERIRRSLAA